MAFVINGITIRDKEDYLKRGARTKTNTTMREDLYKDLKTLSSNIDEPMGVILDCMNIYFQENPKELETLIKMCRNY